MIYLNCGVKGSGKTKILIDLANEKLRDAKGNLVFIDSNHEISRALNRNIRFIALNEFNVDNLSKMNGLISGIIAKDYDVESIFVDGLLKNTSESLEDSNQFFEDLEKISDEFDVDMYINISSHKDLVPDFLRKYNFI